MTFKNSTAKKTIALFLFSALTAGFASSAKADEEAAKWSPLWLGAEKASKGDTYLPDGLTAQMFDLSEDDAAVIEVSETASDTDGEDVSDIVRDIAAEGDDVAEERSPASVKKKTPTKKGRSKSRGKTATRGGLQKVNLTKSGKPQPQMRTTSMASEAQSRWPSSASEGFEFRVRNKAQVSSMWVMKRANNFDVVYATNGGSRVSLTISPEQFSALNTAASELRSTTASTEKCRDSFVQVHVVASGSGRAIASCLDAKGKDADKLRILGATLSSFVR